MCSASSFCQHSVLSFVQSRGTGAKQSAYFAASSRPIYTPSLVAIARFPPRACSHQPNHETTSRSPRAAFAVLLSAVFFLSPISGVGAQTLPEPSPVQPLPAAQTEKPKKKSQRPSSNLPAPRVAEQMLHFSRDSFTDDAWEGMKGYAQARAPVHYRVCFFHCRTAPLRAPSSNSLSLL